MLRSVTAIVCMIALGSAAVAQEAAPAPKAVPTPAPENLPDAAPQAEGPMTFERLQTILFALDPDAINRGSGTELTIADVPVLVIADPIHDRMRAMVPIRSAAGLEPEELLRLMQANFDTALDARYAVAKGRLWGVFLHPLRALEREQLISGLVQAVNVARSYGQSYSSGAAVFGNGDSAGIYQDLLEDLLKKGEAL